MSTRIGMNLENSFGSLSISPASNRANVDWDDCFSAMISLVPIPRIERLIYNGTHTVVKWSDNTTTVVNCTVPDDFDKEVGLAMAISRKYFEEIKRRYGSYIFRVGNEYSKPPRAAFLNVIKNATVYENESTKNPE